MLSNVYYYSPIMGFGRYVTFLGFQDRCYSFALNTARLDTQIGTVTFTRGISIRIRSFAENRAVDNFKTMEDTR